MIYYVTIRKGVLYMVNSVLNKYEHVPYAVISINKDREITACNQHAARILHLPLKEMIQKQYTDIFPMIKAVESFVEGNELVMDTANFTIEDSLFIFSCLFVDSEQNIIGILSKDVASKSNSKFPIDNISFQRVLDSSLDEIFITDGEGNILFINAAAEALYGEKPENLIGRNVLELEEKGYFSPSLYPIVKERKEKVSMVQRTKMGKTHHVIAYPSFDEQKNLIYVVFNARDITEIRYLRDKIERSEALIEAYKSELEELQNFQEEKDSFIAFAPNMLKIKQTIEKIAPFDTTILITGESGVGKGVITQTIHEKSNRHDQPLVHINCGAIPESLIESELFGYESGAFTGAKKDGQKGLIEQANKGILFLDEIGEMPLHFQVKLLKVLQERQFRRIGGSEPIKVDIRIIAATNQDLNKLVEEGAFREDLYYRLNVIPLHIPPLRTRPEDITYMIDYFINTFNEKYNLNTHLSLEAENVLLRYNWPGNIRELQNLMERLVVTADDDEIKVSELPSHTVYLDNDYYAINVNNIVTLKQAQEEMEEQLIRKAYEIDTSSYKIASMLGINQSTAHRKINQYLKKDSL